MILLIVTGSSASFPFPSPDWAVGHPEDHGLSSSKLAEIGHFAGEQKSGCFAVISSGELVYEAYFVAKPEGALCTNCTNGTAPRALWTTNTTSNIHSSTKSITAALVGIAHDLGFLQLSDPAHLYGVPAWAPPNNRSTIRITDLLSMISGLHWEYYSDYFQGMFLSPDKTAFGEALAAQHQAGSWWVYNNMASQVLEAVLRNATQMDVGEFAQEHLFSKIGLGFPHEAVGWYRDQVGHPTVFDGVQLGCRTLARMGYLWLNNGSWAGTQVVSEEYVRASVQPSTKLNSAYGYLWWLGKSGHWVMPSTAPTDPHGGRVEGNGSNPMFGPSGEHMYGMLGGQGQIAIVDPARNAVYVRQGEAPVLGDTEFQSRLMTLIENAYK